MNVRALPQHYAFVVQFHAEADLAQAHYIGRVEHVTSGQAARFHTQAELLAFMERVLRDVARCAAGEGSE